MSTGNELVTLKQVDNYYKDLRKRSAPVIFNSAVGNPVVFSDGADSLPIQSLKVHLLPRQEGTGDPSPSNIRSIIPWNGMTVFGGGKNLFNGQYIKGVVTGNSTQGYVLNTSTNANSAVIQCKGNTTYTVKKHSQSNRFSIATSEVEPENNTPLQLIIENQNLTEYTFTTSEKALYIIVYVSTGTEQATPELQCEVGQTASAYEEYRPITETALAFPSPCYGGTLDVVSGVLTVTHILWTRNTADMDNDPDYPGWKNAGIRDIMGLEKSGAINTMLNVGSTVAINTRNANDIVYLPKSFYSMTQDEWKALAIDAQIALPLETPQTVTLTPAQITALLGNNTIWSDANGNIEVEYRSDTNKFISNAIANQPHAANGGIYGIMTPGAGLSVLNDKIITSPAGTQSIKAGTSSNLIISPAFVGDATFYGLARAAGVDMAQSSNPVGQFTPEALVAIQKMLGVYEPPYELIRDITLTERTNVNITVDDYGQPLSLLSLFMEILYPANAATEQSGYGRYMFYNNNGDSRLIAETSRYLTNTSQTFKLIELETKANRKLLKYTTEQTVGHHGGWFSKFVGTSDKKGCMALDYGNIARIAMNESDYEPAGTRIRVWGQRAY